MGVTMRVMDTSGGQTGTPGDGFPLAAWERLGVLLRQRRGQLDARYRHRNVFAEEVGLKESLLADLENAKRTTFTQETLAAVEVAYGLGPGSIREALTNPSLTEFPHRLGRTRMAEPPASDEVSRRSGQPPARGVAVEPSVAARYPHLEFPPGFNLATWPAAEQKIWLLDLPLDARRHLIVAYRHWYDVDRHLADDDFMDGESPADSQNPGVREIGDHRRRGQG